MNYQQTLDYLYKALPMFHRVGAAAYKPDLSNTIKICNRLGNPQQYIKCIHIAGTNGKGSVSNMFASVLQEAGYRTGLYTSPHLKDFRERIRIDGKMISKKYICSFVEKYQRDFEKIQPSFFEMTVGLAFQYFHEKKVDIAVIETGLGGRLDSTNVITPLISVITNIGYDHMNLLGNTLSKIAKEKAGIIKKDIPVILGEEKKETINIFRSTASKQHAPLYIASKNYKATVSPDSDSKKKELLIADIYLNKKLRYKKLNMDLTGHYQLKNCCTVLQSMEVLKEFLPVSEKHIRKGLSNVALNTGFEGRWQILSKKPLTIADTGHNIDGIKEVVLMLKKQKYKKLHFVLGMVNDKDISSILKLLPQNAYYYFCKAAIPRGLDTDILYEKAVQHKLKGAVFSSVNNALKAAKENAGINDLIFIGGSTFTVAEVV
ncbi:MAG: folylpolyglutamate synthase/dihydrofolate synthase family protein [Bacteroidota bacterium]